MGSDPAENGEIPSIGTTNSIPACAVSSPVIGSNPTKSVLPGEYAVSPGPKRLHDGFLLPPGSIAGLPSYRQYVSYPHLSIVPGFGLYLNTRAHKPKHACMHTHGRVRWGGW